MRTAKRRVLSFVMAMLTVITTVFGHVDYTVKAETTTTYTQVSSVSDITAGGNFVLVAEHEGTHYAVDTGISKKITPVPVSVSEGTVSADKLPVWTIAASGAGVSLSNGASYLAYNSSTNFKTATAAYTWNLVDGANGIQFVASTDSTRQIAYGISQTQFGAYSNKNASGYVFDLLVFKETVVSEEPSEPDAPVVPDEPDTPVVPEVTINKVSEALAASEGTFTVKGVVTLVEGQNIYVQDETGAICVRMSSTPSDIALGDTIIGTGSKTVYNGLPQLGSGTYEKSEGLTLNAKETTIGALATADICTYIELKNVEVTEVYDNNGGWSTPNITVTDGTKSIQIYKAVIGKTEGDWDVKVGDKLNVKAALSVNNTTLRLRNTLASEITVISSGTTNPVDPQPPVTPEEPTVTYNKVSEALAASEGTFTVKGVVTLVDGQNIYVQDETGAICVRMSSTPSDIALGDTIIGTGSKTVYNGLPQLGSGTYEKSEGLTLNAKETTIGALATADICTYIELKNVEVTEVYDNNGQYSNPNVKVTDGTNTIQIYKAVVGKTEGAWDVKVGDKLNVKAALSVNNTTLRLRNTLASEITVVSGGTTEPVDPQPPVTPEEPVAPLVADGKYVIYNPAHSMALSANKTGNYNAGVQMTLNAEGTFDTVAKTEVWEVKNNADGTITITGTAGVLSMAAGYSSMAFDEVNNTWSLEKQADGTFFIKNVGRGNYMEWYDSFSNFSTYYNPSNAKLFKMQFVPVVEGYAKVTSADQLTTGKYVMVAGNGYAPLVFDSSYLSVVQPTVNNGRVTDAKSAIWTLTVSGNEVMITDSALQTIAPISGKTNLKADTYKWLWTFDDTTKTFSFQNQEQTYTLASNSGYENRVRAYKNSTAAGKAYYPEFTLYKVDENSDAPTASTPAAGSEVVIYNVAAKGVLAGQDANVESPSINSALATVEGGKATATNGAVVFKVEQNGNFFRFYNETYGYLCSKGTGNNAYYSLEACDEADWTLETLGDGFKMKNKVAKYNGTSAQYLEYYSDSYKTYSFYGTNKDGTPADTSIYEFHFYACANEQLTGGIVNEPAVVAENLLSAYVGTDYTFDFKVDAPFGVKKLDVIFGNKKLEYTENLGIYTAVVPAEMIFGEKLEIVVSGQDNENVKFEGTIVITVKDEPVIESVTPASGSETGSDKRPVISATIVNAGENPTVTMTINGEAVEAVFADGVVSYTAASDMEDARYSVTVTVTREDGKTANKTWAFTVGKAAYQLYFGQLHSHTTYSDGSGSLESALSYIQNLPESANVDFVAFTDHSNYFDKSGAANPEQALYDMSLATEYSQTTWAEYKKTIADFNASQSDVVALGGFEMTWSGGPGHINTFNTDGIVSRNNATLNNKTKDAGMKAYYALLSQNEGADSLSQFNHPGSTFGTFTDFSYWDAVIDTRIALVEVGNGEGQIGAGGYFPSYEYYTMALDKGWHVAPTNNQDNHKGKWGNANDARDVILTDNFTEEGIYQAIRDMRMYSTEDKNLEVYYTVNGYQLGSSITEVPEKLNINVLVNDPDTSDSISKVEVIVNSGKVAYTWNNPAELAAGELTCELAPDFSYYYIRVTEGDGDLAVTAPVWVGEALKLGISSVECNTSTPVTEEELTLTTTLFNSESSSAIVKSLTYTANGSEVIGVDTNGYTVAASGTLAIDFKYAPKAAKLTKITVTAIVEQEQQEYTFTMDITLDVEDATKLAYIGIDAAHYNEYVAGNYKDSMGNFAELASGYSVRTVELKTSEDLIAACANDKYKALILTAPSRRLEAAQKNPGVYSEAEIAAIKAFNENGGTVVLAGWSDNYENYDVIQNGSIKHMAETQNELLAALGSSLRISDDASYDDVRSAADSVDKWRLYFNTYGENFLTSGIEVDAEHPYDRLYTEVFSHYGGATVYAVDENGNATSTLPATVSPVVYAHSTTYSVDVDKDGLGGSDIPKYAYAEGDNRLLAMAMEQLEGKGAIIVSGAAFMSNFEVQATIEDSVAEKNYSNYKICENLVQYVNPVTVTPIAEVQAQTEVGYKYTIEGIVTSNASGYDKDTAFFDCIYVQDATGGVCCFPVAGNFKIGDKVRVTGTTEFYQGEMELQVTDIEVIGSGSVEAKNVTAAQINNGSVLGQLITVKGTVVSFEAANGLIQTIMVKDAAGNVCRVFIDGYITTDADVKNLKAGNNITVTGIASYDDTFNAPDGPFPRIRIRDREDIVCTTVTPVVPETPVVPFEPVVPSTPEVEDTTENTTTTTPSITIITTPSTGNTVEEENTVVIEDEETPLASAPVITVEVKGEESWTEVTKAVEEVVAAVSKDAPAEVVAITLTKETTVVPDALFTAIEGQNVVVEFQLENGVKWSINGASVTGNVSNLNLDVEVGGGEIPEEVMNTVATTESAVVKVSLAYSGEFGCEAVMNIPVGNENAGKYANLYYFNPETSEMEFIASALIKEDGTADLPFTHASDYAIVINNLNVAGDSASNEVELEEVEVPLAAGPNNSALAILMVIIVLLAATVGTVVFLQKKKAVK